MIDAEVCPGQLTSEKLWRSLEERHGHIIKKHITALKVVTVNFQHNFRRFRHATDKLKAMTELVNSKTPDALLADRQATTRRALFRLLLAFLVINSRAE